MSLSTQVMTIDMPDIRRSVDKPAHQRCFVTLISVYCVAVLQHTSVVEFCSVANMLRIQVYTWTCVLCVCDLSDILEEPIERFHSMELILQVGSFTSA